MFAPLFMHVNSATSDGISLSSVLKFSKFPMNDFIDTDTQIGFESVLSLDNLAMTSRSNAYHGNFFIC